ncbi:MAG: hypothetical protein K2Q12_03815 [Rickettsiales bacterium]|nr:hypothetical protein [Rickettsiales bacterium]
MPAIWKTSLLCLSMLSAASVLNAQTVSADESSLQAQAQTPLMVIRYNQPKVFYQRQLYNAVSRAVAIKSTVLFQLVSFVPSTGNNVRDEALLARAEQQTTAFVRDMNAIGVPSERIQVRREIVSDSPQHEIYLYID